MFNFKSQLLGAAAVLPIAAVVSFAGSAQAVTLNGSIGLNGTSGQFSTAINPNTTTFTFIDVDGVNASGDFANFLPVLGPNPSLPLITINTLTLQRDSIINSSRAIYKTVSPLSWINFGERTLNGITDTLTFELNETQFLRNRLSGTSVSISDLDGLTGKFKFDGDTLASGFLRGSRSGSDSTYQITLETMQSVPEPTTMLGLGLVAAGMTLASRRKLVKA
jgi:hypothetical protein